MDFRLFLPTSKYFTLYVVAVGLRAGSRLTLPLQTRLFSQKLATERLYFHVMLMLLYSKLNSVH
jgi:hypothetical protein